MKYTKTQPNISLLLFVEKCKDVDSFNSTSGKRYKATKVEDNFMKVLRLDGKKPELEWRISLNKLHEAYSLLDNFDTQSFKPFLPRVHSPARGLLIHLGLLK